MNMRVGDTIVSGQNRWQVVGIFEADGGVAETEVWTDVRTLQGAYRRGNTYQSVLAQLDSTDSFDTFRDSLTSNPQVNVAIRRENEYYAAQSVAMTRLIQRIGFAIAALMGIGAVFGAILTMYTAVATRAREIATLRALGFDTAAVLVSVLAESLDAGRDWRRDRRHRRLPGIQRLPDVDDELPDVQPGGVRVPGHAGAAGDGPLLRPGDGTHRRTAASRPRSEAADSVRAPRTVTGARGCTSYVVSAFRRTGNEGPAKAGRHVRYGIRGRRVVVV